MTSNFLYFTILFLRFKNILYKMAESNDEQFYWFCRNAFDSNKEKIFSAIDKERQLLKRTNNNVTLLIWACSRDNPLLVKGLIERGAYINDLDLGGWDALMYASSFGYLQVCIVLLNSGSDPNLIDRYQEYNSLFLAAYNDNLEICLLLISHGANLMLIINGYTALDKYGNIKEPRLSPDELKQRRAILQKAFEEGPHPDMCWKRRWPMMSVMVGCGFQHLAAQLLELEMQRIALYERGELPPSTILDTSERRRAYYMGLVFGNEWLLRLIVMFL
jgi:hypothetical protein